MLTKLLVAPFFIAASAVAHPAVSLQRRGDVPLSEWSSGSLESYWRFKNRYNSLNCASQSGTDFYTNCCYPLGASESLSNRPAECTPATLTCGTPSVSTPTPTPAPDTSSPVTSSPSNADDSYDESSLPYCEAGQDEYGDDDTYTDASYNNGGSSSPDTYTPPASSNNSQAQPTDSGNSGSTDNSGNNNNNNNGGNSGGNTGGANTGGHATYYYQNGVAGACGAVNDEYALIGAIDIAWYGDTGSRSQYCGRNVQITNLNNGKSVNIVVADVCPSCDSANSFDLSVGAFQAIADLSEGYVPISWSFT